MRPAMQFDREEAKRLARDGDRRTRHAIALHADTRPEILYCLVDDPDAEIRRCIAENVNSPRKADLILARDKDEDVRCILAEKIGRLYPDTPAAEPGAIRRIMVGTLEVLAADQASRVRGIVGEALKDLVNAPKKLILKLAYDSELSVCGPILEFSLVLTSEDLIALIQSAPVQGALRAISRRNDLSTDTLAAIADAVEIRQSTEDVPFSENGLRHLEK